MARRARKSRAGLQRWNNLVASLRCMNFAFNGVRLYPPTHTEVVNAIAKLHETLGPVLDEMEDVGFGFMDELLYIEGAMSIEETANNQMLVDRFSRARVKYLTITKGATKQDLLGFFKVVNAEAIKPSAMPPGELLAQEGVSTIHIVEADVDDVASKSKLVRRKTLLDWYSRTVETLRAAQEHLRDGTPADVKPLYRTVDDMMATVRTKGHEPFLLLPAIGRGFEPHAAHAVNVAILCCALGEACGLNSGQIQTLCVSALLHDMGRCTIPSEWTQDHTPLTVFERAVVHQHSTWGFLLLARKEDLPLQTALLAAYHHSNPTLPSPDAAYTADVPHKLLNLADAYDLALAGDKYYWKKQPPARILRSILRRRGRWYDPSLAKLLANLVGYHPVGSLVRLADGRRAIVVRANPANLARPKVWLFEEEWKPPEAPDGLGTLPAAPASQDAGQAAGFPEEEGSPPVILDLMELDAGGLAFKNSIAGGLGHSGLDLAGLLDSKKDYLLSYTI